MTQSKLEFPKLSEKNLGQKLENSVHLSCFSLKNGHFARQKGKEEEKGPISAIEVQIEENLTKEDVKGGPENGHFSDKNAHFVGDNGQKLDEIEEAKSDEITEEGVPKNCENSDGGGGGGDKSTPKNSYNPATHPKITETQPNRY